jgi:hypothetical protein
MEKKVVLIDWHSDNLEGIAENFQTAGWNVEYNMEDHYSTYAQVLKKSPAVLMCCSDNYAEQVREHTLEKMQKKKINVPVFGFL